MPSSTQDNAEAAVRQMLVDFSLQMGLGQVTREYIRQKNREEQHRNRIERNRIEAVLM